MAGSRPLHGQPGLPSGRFGGGLRELRGTAEPAEATRVRRHGGGRKTLISSSPSLLGDLLALVEPTERGDPMSPLRWTCEGTRRLARLSSSSLTGMSGEGSELQAERPGVLLVQVDLVLPAVRV